MFVLLKLLLDLQQEVSCNRLCVAEYANGDFAVCQRAFTVAAYDPEDAAGERDDRAFVMLTCPQIEHAIQFPLDFAAPVKNPRMICIRSPEPIAQKRVKISSVQIPQMAFLVMFRQFP